jgi:DNA-directed RNA polymerase beta subunit
MRLDPTKTFEAIKDKTVEAVKSIFPIESGGKVMEASRVWVDDNKDTGDIKSQKRAKLRGGNWGVPIKAELALKNIKTGRTIDKKVVHLADIPKTTQRFGYIHGGNEYQVDNQWLLRPGVYSRIRRDGSLASEFHTKGKPFNIKFDPGSRKFNVTIGGATPDLYPILRSIGVTDAALEKAWGKKILEANKETDPKSIDRMFKAYTGRKPKDREESLDYILTRFKNTELDPSVTEKTLDNPYTRITPTSLVDASSKLVGISRGDIKPDNRDSLLFKKLKGVEDHLSSSIEDNKNSIQRKIGINFRRFNNIRRLVPASAFQRPIDSLFTGTGLANPTDQINPIEFLSGQTRVTVLGKGGLKTEQEASPEMKLIDPSHLGFVDPVHTPEGGRTGLTLHVAEGATKRGNTLAIPVWDIKNKRLEKKTLQELKDKKLVLPDQVELGAKGVKFRSKKVKVHDIEEGILPKQINPNRADYALITSQQVFSPVTNLIPFVQNNSPLRTTTAGRQLEQALPLADREAPLVQSSVMGESSDKRWGLFNSHRSPVDGEVKKVSADEIQIKGKDKQTHKVQLYHNFPLNGDKAFLDSNPIVSVGDKVKNGDVVADSNFTKDGTLALGKNLRTGYLNYGGLVFEDGVVLSEDAAKKLTSVDLHKKSVTIDKDGKFSKKLYQSYFGLDLPKEVVQKLDDDGVIRKGSLVKPGDILIAALKKPAPTTESKLLSRLHKSLVKPYTDAAVKWEGDQPGIVTDVVKKARTTKVLVKADKPAEVGDKIVGRSGNKGIITSILPEADMPHTADGKSLDILMGSASIPGRVNVGQVLEVAAAKIAEKTGKTYMTSNFDGTPNVLEKVRSELKKHGIDDKELVVDPKTGKTLGKVLVGPQYIVKLKHEVEKKRSSRAGGPGYSYDRDRIPKGGGPHGAQAIGNLGMYGMLAHGTKSNIREMQTWKVDMDQNDKVWTAIQSGMPLPAPRPTFAYEKFTNYIKALGVNMKKDGNTLSLAPMTDKDILGMSNGEIKDPGKVVMALDPSKPDKGGLFDPITTGGLDGLKWSHLKLPEPMPNPVFERAIKKVLNLKASQYEDIVSGKTGIDAAGNIVDGDKATKVGGKALQTLLKNVDVNKELKALEKQLPDLRKTQLSDAHKKIKYLEALKGNNMRPDEAYMSKYIPVLPPSYRPLSTTTDGKIVRDDLNDMYRGVGLISNQLKELGKKLPPSEQVDLRKDLYDGMKALSGLGTHPNLPYKGIIDIIEGKRPEGGKKIGQPKEGFFQDKMIGAKQDLTMRSTITPEPTLALDEVGLPRQLAMETYKPFVVKEIKGMTGISALKAQELIKADDPIANRALERVVDGRPIFLKRDPVLHRYGVQAFKPRLVDGKIIKIHPLVTGAFNADFDGDDQINLLFTMVSKDVKAELMKSNAPWGEASWWDYRRIDMSARFDTEVPFLNNCWMGLVSLEDFPHLHDHTSRKHINYHGVPDGIFVFAMDEEKQEVIPALVSGWSEHKGVERVVINLKSGRSIFTADDPRAVYGIDPQTLEYGRWRPSEAIGKFVPVAKKMGAIGSVPTIPLPGKRLKDSVPVDSRLGRFFGYVIGDGWLVTHKGKLKGQLAFAQADAYMRNEFQSVTNNLFKVPPTYTLVANTHKAFGTPQFHAKLTVSSTDLSGFLVANIGVGHASRKHLPPFFMAASEDFRIGLLSGLLDTDGSLSFSKAKSKPQFLCNFGSTSSRLSQEVILLARSLGVRAKATPSKTPAGKPFWTTSFSSTDLYSLGKLYIKHRKKVATWTKFLAGPDPVKSPSSMRNDLVPVSVSVAAVLQKASYKAKDRSAYSTLSKAKTCGYLSRSVAERALTYVSDGDHPDVSKFSMIVESTDILWDKVESYAASGIKDTGYDLTVPGYETFMSVDGVILSNTMSAHVPISTEAVREAFKIMPSNNLFNPATGSLMFLPSQEMQTGLYMMSRITGKKNLKFKTLRDAEKALDEGKLGITDQVSIGKRKTSIGRLRIASSLPTDLGNKFLSEGKEFNKGAQKEYLTSVARANKNSYSEIANKLKDLGNNFVYDTGFSIGLDDFIPETKIRDAVLKKADAMVDKLPANKVDQKINIYDKATQAMMSAVSKKKANNPDTLYLLQASGVKPGPDQYRQLALAPMLVKNPDGTVVPEPIKKSFSEGLDLADYWTSMGGARRGIIQKVQSVQEPGAITKQMMNSVMDEVVISDDCKTDRGIRLSVDEDDNIVDRVLAKPIKYGNKTVRAGTVMSNDIVSSLKANKVKEVTVRSPLRCAHGVGVCSKCWGMDEQGKPPEVGRNMGIVSAHALGERSTQLALKAFHGGGVVPVGSAVAAKGLTDNFARVQQLLTLPYNVPNSVPLAKKDGRITAIKKDPAGGHEVYIGNERHYVARDRGSPTHVTKGKTKGLQLGMQVKAGDPLAKGPVNPHELLELTNVDRVQRYLSDELYDVYKDQGIDRRAVETVVRGITNTGRVDDPGDIPGYRRGDTVPLSSADNLNRMLPKGSKKLKADPLLRGVNILPLEKSEDWIARLNHQRLSDTIVEAAQQGWKSSIHGVNPIPALMYGAEFGKGPFY